MKGQQRSAWLFRIAFASAVLSAMFADSIVGAILLVAIAIVYGADRL